MRKRCKCGRFLSKEDPYDGSCRGCWDIDDLDLDDEGDDLYDDEVDIDNDADDFEADFEDEPVGRTLLDEGCALTEDERGVFGISNAEYFRRFNW